MPSALEQANFAKRPFNEKQLALNLAQFASDHQDLDLGEDQVENLVGALIVSLHCPLLIGDVTSAVSGTNYIAHRPKLHLWL